MFSEIAGLLNDKEFILIGGFDLIAIAGVLLIGVILVFIFSWHRSHNIRAYYKRMAKIHLTNARRDWKTKDVREEIKKMYGFLYIHGYPLSFEDPCVTLSDIGSSNDEILRMLKNSEKVWAQEPFIKAYKKCVRPNLAI